ncbi:MAG: 16S rRNA (cytidine(1402)-2'-O)-methyltransferase [Gammaproteobacteria bacterium]
MPPAAATLYIVATPIGNLDDLGARAREVLSGVNLIAAEDTRHSKRLLAAWNIRTELLALHEHNEAARTPELVRRLAAGESVALISDAGTPLVSDPGYRLVRAAQDAGFAVRAVPGPCAAVAALSVAGLATDRFAFEGFLPARAAARRKRLGELAAESRTLIFYEAPHRLAAMLADCAQTFGAEREAALARELTKLHETVRRAPLGELAELVASGKEPALGECVVLVSGAEVRASEDDADALLEALLAEGISVKTAADVARRLSARPRRELYQRAIEIQDEAKK